MEWNREAWLGRLLPLEGESMEPRIREKAAELIAGVRAENPGWSPPPFDPRRCAVALDVPVEMSARLGDWDALLIPGPGRPRIFCNGNVRSKGRIAFSIAHEIAHLFFDGADSERYHLRARDREEYYRTPEARELERLCDLAAAELLMPRDCFLRSVADHGFRALTVPVLAEEFGVSREAAAVRLAQTRDRPCAVVHFHYAPQPSAATGRMRGEKSVKYRVRRAFRSGGFPFLFPEGKSVLETSAVFRASLGREELVATETFTLGRTSRRLRATAFPLRRAGMLDEPPAVWATFELA